MKLEPENERLVLELVKAIDRRIDQDCSDLIAIKEKIVARLWMLQCRENMYIKQRDIMIDIQDLIKEAEL